MVILIVVVYLQIKQELQRSDSFPGGAVNLQPVIACVNVEYLGCCHIFNCILLSPWNFQLIRMKEMYPVATTVVTKSYATCQKHHCCCSSETSTCSHLRFYLLSSQKYFTAEERIRRSRGCQQATCALEFKSGAKVVAINVPPLLYAVLPVDHGWPQAVLGLY